MKILWLSHLIPYPPKGGVLQRSHHLLKQLAKYHEVDLLAFNQAPLMRPFFANIDAGLCEASEFFEDVCHRHRFFDIPIDRIKYGRLWLAAKSLVSAPYNIAWLYSSEFRKVMTLWCQEKNYDLVHFDTISLVPYFDILPPGTLSVLDHHNIESHMLLRRASREKNLVKRFYYHQEGVRLEKYERKYCDRFSLNITCSDLDAERLLQISPDCRVQSVPNGVDLEYFAPGIEEEKLRLVFIGRLNWYPNSQAAKFIAEEVWPRIKLKWPLAEFDLVGSNPPEETVELGRKDNSFRVHGFVDDIRPIMARATAYICPIVDGGGTKLKVLDAMAMGKVLIANPIACEGIEVTNAENVLFAKTADDYVQQLERLLADISFKNNLAAKARLLVEEKYSYKAIGRELADLYQGLAAS